MKHLFQILPYRKCLYSGRETINQLKQVLNYIMNAKMLGIVMTLCKKLYEFLVSIDIMLNIVFRL